MKRTGEYYKVKKNTSRIYANGSIWQTNSCGDLTIIGRVDCEGRARYIYEFEDGTVGDATASNIKRGEIKNPFQASVFGIGFLGEGNAITSVKGKQTKVYKVWKRMLERCYSLKAHKVNPTYRNCTVDKRWYNFQNFAEDVKLLDNYNEWNMDTNIRNNWELDKDIKIHGNKVYSKDACMFAMQVDNATAANITGLTYVATRIADEYSENFTNQSKFASKYNLDNGSVNKCLKGKQKTCGGWKFTRKEVR